MISTRFLNKPNEVEYGKEGGDITVEWDFHIEPRSPSETDIESFTFGLWGVPGYVKLKLLYMDEQLRRPQKRQGYETKVDWSGNITKCVNCSAAVTMRNLLPRDFTKYGVDIFLGSHRNPLKHWFELRGVQPPRIVNWLSKLEVQEGNTTTIACTAEGRPLPFVRLQKSNETLCNHTEHCGYKIPIANPSHEGEYECFAQQGKERPVKRRLHLRVVLKDASQPTTETSSPIHLLLVVILVVVTVVFTSLVTIHGLYKRKNRAYRFIDKGKPFLI